MRCTRCHGRWLGSISLNAAITALAWLLLCALVAAGAEREPDVSRYENFRYRLPAGWRWEDKAEASGRYRVIVPPSYPPDRWINVRLYPTEKWQGTLADFVAAQVEEIRQAHGNVAVEPTVVARQGGDGGVDVARATAVVRTEADGSPRVTWFVIYGFQAGDRFEQAHVVHASLDTYRQHAATIDAMLDGARFASMTVLVEGNPPLTQRIVEDTADHIEWLVDVPLTEDHRTWVASQLVAEWKRGDWTEIQGTLDTCESRAQVAALPEPKRAYLREQMLPRVVAEWREKRSDPQCRALLQLYESGRPPIAAGDPPLTRRTTDAAIDALYLIAGQVEGRTVEPTPEQKDAWAKALVEQYPSLPAEQKQAMSQMPLLWAGLRAGWPEAEPEEREAVKRHFAQLEPVKQIIASFPKQEGLSDADFLAEMRKLNRQHEAYTFMSSLSHSYHNANMTMIYNMGRTGWRYGR